MGYAMDAVLWSVAILLTHYSIGILLITPQLAIISSILMLGVRRGLVSLIIMVVILLAGLRFVPLELTVGYTTQQMMFAWSLTLGFMFYIALLVNNTTRNIVATRNQLKDKNRQVEEQAQQLLAISEVAQVVNSTLDLGQVMTTIMESLNQVFSFTQVAILFLDVDEQVLKLERVVGDLSDELREGLLGAHIPMSEKNSAFTETVLSKEPRYLPDVPVDLGAQAGVSALIYQLVPAKSLLTFPLIIDDEVIGVLAFADTSDHFLWVPKTHVN